MTHPEAERELTPTARLELAKRRYVEAAMELNAAQIALEASGSDPWVDQFGSPLRTDKERKAGKPSRRHLELCRQGKLTFSKDRHLRLVRRSDLTAYLESHLVRRRDEDEGIAEVIEAIAKGGRRR